MLAPNGVEEEVGPDYVEYAIYGGEGELPELGEVEAAAGDGLVEVVSTQVPDDWADRWQDFHRPLMVGGRLWLRPSWEQQREGAIDVVVDPGRAFGTGAHPTTRLCLELLVELEEAGEAHGPLTDLGTGSGVLAVAASKLGWAPVTGYDHEHSALEAATANAAANGVDASFAQANLREGLPGLAPTVVANLTAPVLKAVAAQLPHGSGDRGEVSRSLPAVAPGDLPSITTIGTAPPSPSPVPGAAPPGPSPAPTTMVCSGLLPAELDDTIAAFAPAGLEEADRRRDGDWAALLLRHA